MRLPLRTLCRACVTPLIAARVSFRSQHLWIFRALGIFALTPEIWQQMSLDQKKAYVASLEFLLARHQEAGDQSV